jgi:hypothetical protein
MTKFTGFSISETFFSDTCEGKCLKTSLYRVVEEYQWPIVYCPEYNVSVLGLEKLHPFDAGKWGKVYHKLEGTRLRVSDLARFSRHELID